VRHGVIFLHHDALQSGDTIHSDSMSRTRTVAYLRVSTDKQADRGVSLDAQRAKVAAYAELYDLELVEVVVDASASAKTLDRPGLARALGMLRKGGEADALLVVKLDRLTRSVRDLGELVERHFAPGKAALLSVGEQIDTRSAAGRLVLNVLASVSQWEREAIGERTAAAMQHKAACGEFTGGEAGMTMGRRVDLAAVRLARTNLRRLAQEHPELTTEPSTANRRGWEADVEAMMADETKDEQMVVRLPSALLERVDAYAERLRREMPGPSWKRSDVVRLLLAKALDAAEPAKKGKR
jgi:DNA invertase Pin-like site-specific DNA recombinase